MLTSQKIENINLEMILDSNSGLISHYAINRYLGSVVGGSSTVKQEGEHSRSCVTVRLYAWISYDHTEISSSKVVYRL